MQLACAEVQAIIVAAAAEHQYEPAMEAERRVLAGEPPQSDAESEEQNDYLWAALCAQRPLPHALLGQHALQLCANAADSSCLKAAAAAAAAAASKLSSCERS
jgi:hypothetical protein